MLSLRIELLTGRYVASEFNNRNRPEWPPHPARVFSALVASHFEGEEYVAGVRALRWLEALPAPRLAFSDATARDLKIHFVPVNDKALSDSSSIDKAWAKVFAAGTEEPQRSRAEKRLADAYSSAAARKKRLARSDPADGRHILPAGRTRQPRTFPSVTPNDPVVHYIWDAEPDAETRAGLNALAGSLVRLGHSSSLVAASWLDDAPNPTLVPDPSGSTVLRWVTEGQFDALVRRHSSEPHAEQRVMPYVLARYRPDTGSVEVPRSSFASNFLVLRRVQGPRLPIEVAELLADAVRAALMSHADQPVDALISGHAADGSPLSGDHLAIVPLPYVAGSHATGELLGIALVPAADFGLDDLQPLYRALGRWEDAGDDSFAEPSVRLTLGRLGTWVLQREFGLSPLLNLRESTWTRASRVWSSVTPVVFDRHPGSFSKQRARAVRKSNETMAAACRRVGLPEPVEIELSDAPLVRGSEHARRFSRRPGSSDRRPLVHVRLLFSQPVAGPVLLGAGRYRGLGLLRPSDTDHE